MRSHVPQIRGTFVAPVPVKSVVLRKSDYELDAMSSGSAEEA